MDITNIKAYDPKQDGLDFQNFKAAYYTAHTINPSAAYAMSDGLIGRVLKSEVESGVTLKQLLFEKDGFFDAQRHNHPNNRIVAVLFMDGKFHSKYTRANYTSVDLDKLAEEANSIPFMLSCFPEIDQYLRERTFMGILTEQK